MRITHHGMVKPLPIMLGKLGNKPNIMGRADSMKLRSRVADSMILKKNSCSTDTV
jgi:hypothetical protein